MFNSSRSSCFTNFTSDISQYQLPEKFTYPFHYRTHALALVASKELQQKLKKCHPVDSEQQGRMYGVLIVKDIHGSLGYLSALSGNANESLGDDNSVINFVPTIHQAYEQSAFEKIQQVEINDISHTIIRLTANTD
ncbi:MAG: tRNA pseudouridine32 synthase/23S rRNA pseudouridine746 synthase, partial [Colwellia sp.]